MAKTKQDPPPLEQPFVQHLIELRDRLMRIVLVVVLVFLALFAFANDIYSYLAEPLMRHLPEGASMIATEVASPFLTPFKLTLVISVFIAVPVILYHVWGFIAPGLYKNERRLVFPLMFSSTILFFLGMAFAYYVVFPLVFGFLIGIAPEGVAVMTDISKYLDFVLKMFFAFGIAFEVPIATILVVWSGMTTAEELAKKRPYIIVGAFVFGMLLTPPDVISQTLLALPMWVLFELGLIFSRWYTKPQEDEDEGEEDKPVAPVDKPGPAGAAVAAAEGVTETVVVNGTTVTTTPDGKTTFNFGDGTTATSGGTDATAPATPSIHEKDDVTEADMDAELDRIEKEEALEEIQGTVQAGEVEPESVAETEQDAEQEISRYDSPELAEELRAEEIDNEAHAKATSEAEAIARAAAGDIGDYRERVSEIEDDQPKVFTEEDHQRATEEAMAIARAAAGLPDPEPEAADESTAPDSTSADSAAAEETSSVTSSESKPDPEK